MTDEMLANLLMFGGLIGGLWAYAQLGTWVTQGLSAVTHNTLSWLVYTLSLVILFMGLFIVA